MSESDAISSGNRPLGGGRCGGVYMLPLMQSAYLVHMDLTGYTGQIAASCTDKAAENDPEFLSWTGRRNHALDPVAPFIHSVKGKYMPFPDWFMCLFTFRSDPVN